MALPTLPSSASPSWVSTGVPSPTRNCRKLVHPELSPPPTFLGASGSFQSPEWWEKSHQVGEACRMVLLAGRSEEPWAQGPEPTPPHLPWGEPGRELLPLWAEEVPWALRERGSRVRGSDRATPVATTGYKDRE